MTRSGRRAVFLIVATVANFLVTIILMALLMLLWSAISGLLSLSQDSVFPAFMAAFLLAVVLSGFIYSRVLRYLSDKPELVERFGLSKK